MPGRLAAAMGEDLEARRRAGVAALATHALRVDGDDDALGAEFLRRRAHEIAVLHRRGVDRDLVGAGLEQLAHIVELAHAAAHGERHEAALGRAPDDVEDGVAVLVARGDVEEAELVGARLVIGGGGLHRIAGVTQVDEFDALDDAAVFHVKAGDDADLEHG